MWSADRSFCEALSALGRDAGLAAVGVAVAQPFTRARAAMADRIDRGYAAGMSFTFRTPDRSCDPTQSLPGARALVVGAYRYRRAEPRAGGLGTGGLDGCEEGEVGHDDDGLGSAERPSAGVFGRVARYTWADRYKPLEHGLTQISQRLRAEGWRTRILADDNALVDREAAYQAGLGWYGKNANLLIADLGSWFLLGSVLTDAPLPATAPGLVADGCGPCVRCLPACPTGAIVSAGVVDGRRCLSWLLQAPGSFPLEHRIALGDRLYGCDDCQEVCPINRLGDRRDPPSPAEAGDEAFVELVGLLSSDDAMLLRRFARWYLPDRQVRIVRRNALVVLGNLLADDPARAHDAPVEAVLRAALADDDAVVRGHGVWAVGRSGRHELLASLHACENDPSVRAELAIWGG